MSNLNYKKEERLKEQENYDFFRWSTSIFVETYII
jgi:hypothetical protein